VGERGSGGVGEWGSGGVGEWGSGGVGEWGSGGVGEWGNLWNQVPSLSAVSNYLASKHLDELIARQITY